MDIVHLRQGYLAVPFQKVNNVQYGKGYKKGSTALVNYCIACTSIFYFDFRYEKNRYYWRIGTSNQLGPKLCKCILVVRIVIVRMSSYASVEVLSPGVSTS